MGLTGISGVIYSIRVFALRTLNLNALSLIPLIQDLFSYVQNLSNKTKSLQPVQFEVLNNKCINTSVIMGVIYFFPAFILVVGGIILLTLIKTSQLEFFGVSAIENWSAQDWVTLLGFINNVGNLIITSTDNQILQYTLFVTTSVYNENQHLFISDGATQSEMKMFVFIIENIYLKAKLGLIYTILYVISLQGQDIINFIKYRYPDTNLQSFEKQKDLINMENYNTMGINYKNSLPLV